MIGEDLRPSGETDGMEGFRFGWQPIIFGGVGILIPLILFALFFPAHKTLRRDLRAIKFRLEMMEARFPQLVGQVIELQQRVSRLDKSGSGLSRRLDELSQEMARLQKEEVALSKGRYHEVRQGETLYRIAKKYSVSMEELRRLNHMGESEVIKPGQKLLVPSQRVR